MADLATMLVEEGRVERNIEIAKNALREGSSIEFIVKITGLDEFAIEELQDELDNN